VRGSRTDWAPGYSENMLLKFQSEVDVDEDQQSGEHDPHPSFVLVFLDGYQSIQCWQLGTDYQTVPMLTRVVVVQFASSV
jgi:hypothetical protein